MPLHIHQGIQRVIFQFFQLGQQLLEFQQMAYGLGFEHVPFQRFDKHPQSAHPSIADSFPSQVVILQGLFLQGGCCRLLWSQYPTYSPLPMNNDDRLSTVA